jgi:DNA-binding transcriptional MocR family regulator
LQSHLPGALSYSVPEGGMSVWATLRNKNLCADALSEAAAREGVAFFPGSRFTFDGSQPPTMRLSFAALSDEELEEAARRLAIAYEKVSSAQTANSA